MRISSSQSHSSLFQTISFLFHLLFPFFFFVLSPPLSYSFSLHFSKSFTDSVITLHLFLSLTSLTSLSRNPNPHPILLPFSAYKHPPTHTHFYFRVYIFLFSHPQHFFSSNLYLLLSLSANLSNAKRQPDYFARAGKKMMNGVTWFSGQSIQVWLSRACFSHAHTYMNERGHTHERTFSLKTDLS